MKRTGKKLVMLMTVLFLLIMGTGATIAWGSVTVPTKGRLYIYNRSKKKWKKTEQTFSATYTKDGKLKKIVKYFGGSDKSTTSYQWNGDYLKKITYSFSDGSSSTRTFTYKNGKPSKIVFSDITTTYTWKGNKGTAIEKMEDDTNRYTLTMKNGRLVKNRDEQSQCDRTYTYYKKGLRKTYTSDWKNYKYKITYGKNGLPKKINDGPALTTSYSWKKKEILITDKENGKVVSKIKWKISKTKKVSRAWNCDAYGYPVLLFEVSDFAS